MAIADTLSALQCIPVCPEMRSLSDAQFFTLVIEKLATAGDIDLSTITAGDLQTAVEDGLCDLQDRSAFYNVSPEVLKALVLHLVNEVAA